MLKEGNYLINIRILEASDLIPSSSSGVANPLCVVRVIDKTEKTKVMKKTLSPIWDQSFTFEFEGLTKQRLENATITIEVWDHSYFLPTVLIGAYEIDLTTVYFQKHHQYYRV
jgi:Ca2+-dependent lipid-binding protein